MTEYIYVVIINNAMKIGKSTNCESRLKTLQTGCSHPIEIIKIFTVVNCTKIESFIHHVLREYRTSGEFFNCSSEFALDVIERICQFEHLSSDNDTNQLLSKTLCIGSNYDYIRLSDLKRLFNRNGDVFDKDTVFSCISSLFPDSKFYDRKMISKINHKNIFINLKFIPNYDIDKISDLLHSRFELGCKRDYVRLIDIKSLFKENDLELDKDSIISSILQLFPYCKFYDRKMIDKINHSNLFINLKNTKI